MSWLILHHGAWVHRKFSFKLPYSSTASIYLSTDCSNLEEQKNSIHRCGRAPSTFLFWLVHNPELYYFKLPVSWLNTLTKFTRKVFGPILQLVSSHLKRRIFPKKLTPSHSCQEESLWYYTCLLSMLSHIQTGSYLHITCELHETGHNPAPSFLSEISRNPPTNTYWLTLLQNQDITRDWRTEWCVGIEVPKKCREFDYLVKRKRVEVNKC